MEEILLILEEAHEILLKQSESWKTDPNALSRAGELVGEAISSIEEKQRMTRLRTTDEITPKSVDPRTAAVFECSLLDDRTQCIWESI